MSKLLITGATGFLGKALCETLKLKKYSINISTRSDNHESILGLNKFIVGDINSKTNWSSALRDIDCVVHCAARTHIMKKEKSDIIDLYRKINVEGTRNLAIQAANLGVRRLIFLSSVKVNGERTTKDKSFNIYDIPKPEDPYGISKWETEQVLREISEKTGLEIVIIRAPLIYGKEVKGNFLRLINLIFRGIPLPFARIENCRSLIGLDNLINLIECCIDHPEAIGKTFLASDNENVSTTLLITKLAKFLKKNPLLFHLPIPLMNLLGNLTGKSKEIKRLLFSLKINNSYTNEVLGWKPPYTLDDGLKKTVKWYLENR